MILARHVIPLSLSDLQVLDLLNSCIYLQMENIKLLVACLHNSFSEKIILQYELASLESYELPTLKIQL